MRKEDLREATRKKSRKKKKFTKRDNIFHKDKSNSKRIATVASVYEIARFIRKPVDIIQDFFLKPESKRNTKRPRPKAKRVWASLENSSEKVINEIFEEALGRIPRKSDLTSFIIYLFIVFRNQKKKKKV